ncbi:hypothetical protein B0H15DRAFT_805118 [Mycena belliarum]|uniref:Uncharacterized protein n=1 Tax=Mycena belliarum TaxID=1033014 RepID=A0AAD6XL28_9AGAR|nr:hypothetical protein B0H15DRAFT_805118 [Mycena belliae]
MDSLYMNWNGVVAEVFTKRVNRDDEFSPEWCGLGFSCSVIPDNALDSRDRALYIDGSADFDDAGHYRGIEPALHPDWDHPDEPYRAWIPLRAEEGAAPEWWQDFGAPARTRARDDGLWEFFPDDRAQRRADLELFRSLMEGVAEHPKYDLFIWCPPLFDVESLDAAYVSDRDAQRVSCESKRSMLEIWGHLSRWTSCIADWDAGLPANVAASVINLSLSARPKRGVLLSLTRDWKHVNIPLLVRHEVPVFYVWGMFEQADKRFYRLNPTFIRTYLDECRKRNVRSMWGDEVTQLRQEFQIMRNYDKFLDMSIDPMAKPHASSSAPCPVLSADTGIIVHMIKDFASWGRRRLAFDEEWRVLDKLYHHVVVEDRGEQTTTIIFHRHHRKPRSVLLSGDDFMDEEIPEQDLVEIRERFSGRCAPKMGQFFDPATGVEREAPVDTGEPGVVERVEISRLLVPPPNGLGGPRFSSPRSDHSSERHPEDSNRPMAYEVGWVEAMAREDHVGNYRRRPGASLSPAAQLGSLRARISTASGDEEWGANITYTSVMWRIPSQFSWNMSFIKDAYLICSDATEVRLRFLAIMTPGVRFARHVLEIGIEHGLSFQLGVKASICEKYAPREPQRHRSTTKAQIEGSDRRLEAGSSPTETYNRFLRLMGVIAELPQARSIIGRGGVASWLVRAYGYVGLVERFMAGPSVQTSVYFGGADDSGDVDAMGLRWDELAENDYQCLYGYVAGSTREKDTWIFPPDEMVEELSRHYYREWNPVVDDLFKRIKAEWDDRPCRGRLRTRREWKDYFHSSNHGRLAPVVIVDHSYIEEGKARLMRGFEVDWRKKRVWELPVPEVFRPDF